MGSACDGVPRTMMLIAASNAQTLRSHLEATEIANTDIENRPCQSKTLRTKKSALIPL